MRAVWHFLRRYPLTIALCLMAMVQAVIVGQVVSTAHEVATLVRESRATAIVQREADCDQTNELRATIATIVAFIETSPTVSAERKAVYDAMLAGPLAPKVCVIPGG